MRPRFRRGEIVRVLPGGEGIAPPGSEGIVEGVDGPNEEGTGWNLTVRIGGRGSADSLVLGSEQSFEPTGMGENERGERTILERLPVDEELRTCLELRLFTEIADGIDAARVAETIEQELVRLVGGVSVAIVAERHWSEPYNYELDVTMHPLDSPIEALRTVVEAGSGGWIACRDDGWRYELWWSTGGGDGEALLLVPEVRGAEVAFLPWSSPARRPVSERPLVPVEIRETAAEPGFDDPEAGDGAAAGEEGPGD